MKIENLTIGADPEMFIVNTKTDKVVSAVGLIPGVKGKPYRTKTMPLGYGLEIDNILAEFNIPPCRTADEFINSINYMKDYIRRFVKRRNPDYDILCSASQLVDEDQLQSPEAKLFGCSVDYNAYTCDVNPKPNGESTNLRSAGFHIHLGYDCPERIPVEKIIKYLDMYLGAPSVFIDTDERRRTLYGKAGCFRMTDYGCEYRVLSSRMLATDGLINWVYDGIMLAVQAFNEDKPLYDADKIIKGINCNETDLILDLKR